MPESQDTADSILYGDSQTRSAAVAEDPQSEEPAGGAVDFGPFLHGSLPNGWRENIQHATHCEFVASKGARSCNCSRRQLMEHLEQLEQHQALATRQN